MDMKFDVIIVGAGISGLAAGALLAMKEKKRVLVLEKESRICGRGISFRGAEIRDKHEFAQLMKGAASTWVVRAIPDIDTMINKGLLKGYTFEAGIHLHYNADAGRTANVLKEIVGRPLKMGWNDTAEYYSGGEFFSVVRGKFPWMSQKDFEELHRISKEMVKTPIKEAKQYDHISLGDYLKQRTDNVKAHEFHAVAGSYICTINDEYQISAGDVIKTNRATALSGCHFANKSSGMISERDGGFDITGLVCADVLRENGGTILTEAEVKEIIITNGRATGVLVEVDKQQRKFEADVVICNLPTQKIFKIIDKKLFPEHLVRRFEGFWSAGSICGYFGLKKPLYNSKTMVWAPNILSRGDGFAGDVRCGMWVSSLYCAGRAPEGKQLLDIFSPCTDIEARDKGRVDKIIDATMDFMRGAYKGFDEILEWALFTSTDSLCPVAQAPGQVSDHRLPVKCPWVDKLFFVGESVGSWGCTTDTAMESALNCVSQVIGKNYMSLLPSYYLE